MTTPTVDLVQDAISFIDENNSLIAAVNGCMDAMDNDLSQYVIANFADDPEGTGWFNALSTNPLWLDYEAQIGYLQSSWQVPVSPCPNTIPTSTGCPSAPTIPGSYSPTITSWTVEDEKFGIQVCTACTVTHTGWISPLTDFYENDYTACEIEAYGDLQNGYVGGPATGGDEGDPTGAGTGGVSTQSSSVVGVVAVAASSSGSVAVPAAAVAAATPASTAGFVSSSLPMPPAGSGLTQIQYLTLLVQEHKYNGPI